MLAGVTPQHLREGNLSGMNEVVLSQGGVGGKNPEKLWKTFPRGKALGNDPCCVGLGGVDGIPLPHLYTSIYMGGPIYMGASHFQKRSGISCKISGIDARMALEPPW